MNGIVADRTGTRVGADEALVRLAQRGDVGAFDRLAAPRIGLEYRTAVAILGNEADARDAVQDAFVSAWRELPHLRDATRFDAWLGRIVVNACRLAVRSAHRRTVHEIPVDALGLIDPPAGGTRIAEETAALDSLERAFDRLSVDHRAVLVLHHLRGQSLEQIAVDLAIPVGTVKSRHHAARRELAAALEAESR